MTKNRTVSELAYRLKVIRNHVVAGLSVPLDRINRRVGGFDLNDKIELRDAIADGLDDMTFRAICGGGDSDVEPDASGEARDQLLQQLQKAKLEFVNEDRRRGAAAALFAVSDYIDAIQPNRGLITPLEELLYALIDADRGLSNLLTAPVEYSGGSRKRTSETMKMTTAAVAVTLLTKAGEPLTTALSRVGRILSPAVSANELREFRKNILCGRAPAQAITHYERRIRRAAKSAAADNGMSSMDLAQRELKRLRERWGQA